MNFLCFEFAQNISIYFNIARIIFHLSKKVASREGSETPTKGGIRKGLNMDRATVNSQRSFFDRLIQRRVRMAGSGYIF